MVLMTLGVIVVLVSTANHQHAGLIRGLGIALLILGALCFLVLSWIFHDLALQARRRLAAETELQRLQALYTARAHQFDRVITPVDDLSALAREGGECPVCLAPFIDEETHPATSRIVRVNVCGVGMHRSMHLYFGI
jgi:hypothetical protein